MKGILARSIAIIAVGSVLSLAGAGVAAASAVDSASDRVTGSSSAVGIGQQITEITDGLKTAAAAADVSKVTALVDEARSVVGGIITGQRGPVSDDVSRLAAEAFAEADNTEAAIDEHQARGMPDPVAILKTVIQSLLAALTSLLDAVLAAAPAAPGLPDLPAPGLPVPELPAPGVPDLPAPGLPLP